MRPPALRLSPRERDALAAVDALVGEGVEPSCSAIARRMGVNKSRVSQLLRSARAKQAREGGRCPTCGHEVRAQ